MAQEREQSLNLSVLGHHQETKTVRKDSVLLDPPKSISPKTKIPSRVIRKPQGKKQQEFVKGVSCCHRSRPALRLSLGNPFFLPTNPRWRMHGRSHPSPQRLQPAISSADWKWGLSLHVVWIASHTPLRGWLECAFPEKSETLVRAKKVLFKKLLEWGLLLLLAVFFSFLLTPQQAPPSSSSNGARVWSSPSPKSPRQG